MTKRIHWLLWLVILVPSVFVFISFFKPLHLAWGDAPYIYPEAMKEFLRGLPLWSEKGIAFGGRNLALWLSPLMILYGTLGEYLHFGNDLIVRIIFYFPSIILAGIGPYLLVRQLKLSKTVAFFASFVYLLNTYFLLLIDGGQVGIALAYGIFPFTVSFWNKFTNHLSIQKFLIAVLSLFVLCLADPRIAIIAVLFTFLWQILLGVFERNSKSLKDVIWLILAGLLLVPLNLFWLSPLLKSGFGGISTAVSDLQLSSLLNSLFLFAPNWPSNLFGKVIPPYFYFAAVPMLIFGGFLFKKLDKKFYSFAFIFLIFTFLAKGTTPPLGNIYSFLVNKMPFGSIFRDSTKFFVVLTLAGGVLIGNAIEQAMGLVRNKIFRAVLFGAAYLYLLLLISPALFGKMNFNLSGRTEGTDFRQIYENLKNEPGSFRTLWFNQRPQIAFETAEKPAINADQLISFRPFAAITVGEDAYNFLNYSEYVNLLRIFGIKYVFMSGDPRNPFPTETDAKNWFQENKLVLLTKGLVKQNWDTQMPVYRVENIRPNVYSVPKMVIVVGADVKPTAELPAIAYLEDGKFDPGLLKDIKPSSIELFFNNGKDTDLTMSYLQRYFKSPKEARSMWAVYDSNQYLKYKYELLTRGYKFNDFDYDRGIAFSTKLDEKITFSFDVPRDGEYVVAKRFGSLKSPKLEWSFEKVSLKAGEFKYVVNNTTGIEVLNTVAVIPESEFNTAKELSNDLRAKFTIRNSLENINLHPAELNHQNGLSYEYRTEPKDNWIIFSQNFDPGWTGSSKIHIPVYSMINGFYIENPGKVKINFRPL